MSIYFGRSLISTPKLGNPLNLTICSSVKGTLYFAAISRNAFILAVELLIPKNALPLSSMVTIIWLSGKSTIPIDDGGSTTTGSAILKEAVNIKNVTSRKAKSTIGVMSSAGAPPFDGFFDIFNSF